MIPLAVSLVVAWLAQLHDANRDAAIARGTEYIHAARRIVPEDEEKGVDTGAELPQLEARRARIRDELASLGAHDWAGVYYEGDGLGVNLTLTLAPDAGATYTWTGCLGTYDLNHGNIVSVSPDGIDIELSVSTELNHVWYRGLLAHPYMSSRWIPVPWGAERFMIPDSQMILFCNAVSDGSRRFPFPRRIENDDWHRTFTRPESPPQVPPAYRPFLLEKPLSTEITACSEPTEIGAFDDGTAKYLASATVAMGSDAGLLPGMQLYGVWPAHGTGVVVEVEPQRASVEFRFAIHHAQRDTPRQGWALSTRRGSGDW